MLDFADRRAGEIVGAERGLVGDRAPVVRQLLAVVAELEQRLDQLLVRLRRALDQRLLSAPDRSWPPRAPRAPARSALPRRAAAARRQGRREARRRTSPGSTHLRLLRRRPLARAPSAACSSPCVFIRAVVLRERIHHDPLQHGWIACLSSGVSSWKTRGATKPVLVGERNTLVMPFGTSPCQFGPDQQIEAGRRAVHLAELHEAVGAQIDDLIDPEAVAEVRHLDHHRREIERRASRRHRRRPGSDRRRAAPPARRSRSASRGG